MAASAKFLSAVGIAFVAGVASTSAYMSRGDVQTDAPELSHGSAPSLTERLQAEAQGRSLPWSDPTKATVSKPASPKLGPPLALRTHLQRSPPPTRVEKEGPSHKPCRGLCGRWMTVTDVARPDLRMGTETSPPALSVERIRPARPEPSQRTLNEERGSSRPRSQAWPAPLRSHIPPRPGTCPRSMPSARLD